MGRRLVLGLAMGATLVALPLAAQVTAPTANVGLSGQLLTEIALAGEFETVGNRMMRMRVLTIAPGGVIGLHNHQNRPSVEYVLSGNATEYRGAETRRLGPGDFISADHTTEHWWQNDMDAPLVILAVDIYQPATP